MQKTRKSSKIHKNTKTKLLSNNKLLFEGSHEDLENYIGELEGPEDSLELPSCMRIEGNG